MYVSHTDPIKIVLFVLKSISSLFQNFAYQVFCLISYSNTLFPSLPVSKKCSLKL